MYDPFPRHANENAPVCPDFAKWVARNGRLAGRASQFLHKRFVEAVPHGVSDKLIPAIPAIFGTGFPVAYPCLKPLNPSGAIP